VSIELGHEGLAEPHDLVVASTLRIEVGPPLRAAHRQAGEGILEGLLEAEELEGAQGHARVKPQPPLVRADRVVELDAPGPVDVVFPVVVDPGNPEGDDAVRLAHPLEDFRMAVFVVLDHERHQRLDHLVNGLVKLRFSGVPPYHPLHEGVDLSSDICSGHRPLLCLLKPPVPGRPKP
jgi:hypothetical protein